MNSVIVPLFGDKSFDELATKNMGLAYEIACRSVHPRGKPPVIQDVLAKKILQVAQTGERDPDRLAAMALTMLGPFRQDVSQHFGLVPNFFMSAPDAPEVLERLWDFAKAAYFNNPMPSVFKERLFVYLSRFCRVRYCIVRHCGFLVGYGHSAGDHKAEAQTITHAIRLMTVAPPWKRDMEQLYGRLEACNEPIDWPESDSELEDALFAACAVIFVQPEQSERARNSIRRALGARRFEFLLALLTFVRSAHYWTMLHPGLEIEDDMRELMEKHKDLAVLLLEDPVLP